jgi:hypothetical protein
MSKTFSDESYPPTWFFTTRAEVLKNSGALSQRELVELESLPAHVNDEIKVEYDPSELRFRFSVERPFAEIVMLIDLLDEAADILVKANVACGKRGLPTNKQMRAALRIQRYLREMRTIFAE